MLLATSAVERVYTYSLVTRWLQDAHVSLGTTVLYDDERVETLNLQSFEETLFSDNDAALSTTPLDTAYSRQGQVRGATPCASMRSGASFSRFSIS